MKDALASLHWLLLAAAVIFLAGCGGKAETRPLRIGMELAYPPFEMTDEMGQPSGVSVDLANALGTALGEKIEIQNMPFDGLIPALKTGKIDLILSSMTRTAERAESIDFTEPYLTTGLCLLVGKDSGVASVADLRSPDRRVVVKKGTTGQIYAARELQATGEGPQVRALDKENLCVLEVAQGKADAFIYDQMSTLKNAQQHPQTTRALLQPFATEVWAIGLRKGDDVLRERVNHFLQEYRASGGFERLGDRWLQEQKAAFRKLGVPFVF